MVLIAMAAAGSAWALGVHAGPPEGKGQGGGSHGNGGRGHADSGRGKGNSGKGGRETDNDAYGPRGGDAVAGLVYAGITAALARSYALDAGISGYASLPPGIRKNLARGKPLPPGIAKKMVPGPLLGRLPRHAGYEWRVAGTDLILISIATAVVADVLYDVFD
ncbi:MAG: anti-virulence regulator CigR family protein [Castellaniella sp.]